ncbi:hypothetical protein ACETK3_18555 [Arthrobacter sp. E44]|uniref:hypothetical protein n=1 Tax=Arthrobacter sp. E44 TaxID=3341794 RepID=UPI0035A5A6B6
MTVETYIVAAVAGAVLFLFAIIQPGLAHDRRKFGEKTYSSVEGMFMVWGFLALVVGVFGQVFSVTLDIAAGGRNSDILTDETINALMVAAMTAAAIGGTLQWARLRAAFRKEQQASLRIAHDS